MASEFRHISEMRDGILAPGRGGEASTKEVTFGNNLPAGVGVPRLTRGWGLGRVFQAEDSSS